jgi:hypothetical protein
MSGAFVRILNSFGADFSNPSARDVEVQPVATNATEARAENRHAERNIV